MIRTVLELDLAGYTDIAVALEEALDIHAVRAFEDQIQALVDEGLAVVGLERDRVVLGTAGDNAILIFESADQMHRFAATVQQAARRHNAAKTTPLARRWFRMGAATGEIELIPERRRIVGTTIARAVRLEAASEKGSMLIDAATYEALPEWLRKEYGPPQTVKGKRDERYTAYKVRFIEEGIIDDEAHRSPSRDRRRLLAVFSCLAASAAVALVFNFWPTRKSTPPGPPSQSPAVKPIHGAADIRVFNPKVPERNDRSISYAGLLPLRPGDRVRLEVRLERPGFVYLLWIAPSGDVVPVYPWKPGDWTRVDDQRPISRLICPSEESDGFPMKEDVEGREVFLAMVRSSPLPADVDLKAIVSRCASKLPIRNPKSLVRFRNNDLEATSGQDRDPDFLLPTTDEDPFRRMAERLKAELGANFEFVDGAAFASQIAPE